MDVLSDVIAVIRTGEPVSARVTSHAPWGQRYAAVAGSAGFRVVLQGSCWLFPQDGPPLALNAGDVVFLPHAREHALADSRHTPLTGPPCGPGTTLAQPSDGDGDGQVTVTLCGAYRLDPARTHPLLKDLPEVVHLPAGPDRHPDLQAAVDLLSGELLHPRPGSDAAVRTLLDMLLLYLLRAWYTDRPSQGPATGWIAALNDPSVSAALHGIHHEPDRPWTVESLAGQAGLSRAAFSRRFTALVGQPPLTYLTWWRMTLATRHLQDTTDPLSMIATRVGYSSEFTFAHAFKRHTGISPGRYRRQPA